MVSLIGNPTRGTASVWLALCTRCGQKRERYAAQSRDISIAVIATTGGLRPFIFKPATIEALAKLVQVVDQHRFGAVMLVVLVVLMVAAGSLIAIPYLQR